MQESMPRIAELLREWRRQHGGDGDTPEAIEPLREIVVANESSIRWALDAVGAMSYQQMVALMREHRTLNDPAGVPVDYAKQLVDSLTLPGDDWGLSGVDDYANVLKRVLEYAEYAE